SGGQSVGENRPEARIAVRRRPFTTGTRVLADASAIGVSVPTVGSASELAKISLWKPGCPQGVPHLLAIGRLEAPHAVVGVRFADRESRAQPQQRRDVRLGFVGPANKRQRVGHLEMAEPELLDKGLLKGIQRLRIFTAEPVAFGDSPPPPARR